MNAKKTKDLVSELIGDLLSDDGSKTIPLQTQVPATISSVDENSLQLGETTPQPATRTAIGGKFAVRSTTPTAQKTEMALVQSENLRVAQQRIIDLESEIERLRRENEQLAAAGDTFRKKADELQSDSESKAQKLQELKERMISDREILEASLKAKDRDIKEYKMKIEEFEVRLSSNLQKIRVRERELENRLELMKMESTALQRNKDEMILELKRQIDQLNHELENYRAKGQDLHRQVNEKQETLRRTVKALRLALTLLEGGAEEGDPTKKAK